MMKIGAIIEWLYSEKCCTHYDEPHRVWCHIFWLNQQLQKYWYGAIKMRLLFSHAVDKVNVSLLIIKYSFSSLIVCFFFFSFFTPSFTLSWRQEKEEATICEDWRDFYLQIRDASFTIIIAGITSFS